MCTRKEISELRVKILNNDINFLDIVVDVMQNNSIVFSDNHGVQDLEVIKAFNTLPVFMEMLYLGSKHSIGKSCENKFTRIIEHDGMLLKLVYNSGPEEYVAVEKLQEVTGRVKIVTLDLLKVRLKEEEEIKEKLRPVIAKYINDGLTYKEITRIFVDVMIEFK